MNKNNMSLDLSSVVIPICVTVGAVALFAELGYEYHKKTEHEKQRYELAAQAKDPLTACMFLAKNEAEHIACTNIKPK